MKIAVLVENTSYGNKLESEHGLSLYIETAKHKILFDAGKSEAFSFNAETLGIDLSKVDIAFLSHGHYDHGGGLKRFLSLNKKAMVYARKEVFNDYYAQRENGEKHYIGIDKELISSEKFILNDSDKIIDSELELFSDVTERKLPSKSNDVLLEKKQDEFIQDTFLHEQNLIITENGKTLLVAGCAHSGIVNIVNRFHAIKQFYPDFVIGGFHLYNPTSKKSESCELVAKVGKTLDNGTTIYYTGHCTGQEAFCQLKDIMGIKIHAISTGMIINI